MQASLARLTEVSATGGAWSTAERRGGRRSMSGADRNEMGDRGFAGLGVAEFCQERVVWAGWSGIDGERAAQRVGMAARPRPLGGFRCAPEGVRLPLRCVAC